MKKTKLKILLLAVGLVLCSFGGVFTALAEGEKSSTIILSPMTQKVILAPGETTTMSVKVSNPSDSELDLDYAVSIGSFSQKRDEDGEDDYGTVDVDSVSDYNMLMDWITLEKDSGTVPPNETDIVKFTISVPEDAPAGGQYATILVRDETKRIDEVSGNVMIQSVTQLASIIYAEVAGETKNDGQIVKNNIPGFVLSNPMTATSIVRNDGNVHTDATYILQVWPMFSDEEICTNEEKPSTSLVMPETEKFHAESCNLPSIGIFRAKQTVSIFGETTITEKTFIMCPVWLLFVIVMAVVLVVIWFIAQARNRKKGK